MWGTHVASVENTGWEAPWEGKHRLLGFCHMKPPEQELWLCMICRQGGCSLRRQKMTEGRGRKNSELGGLQSLAFSQPCGGSRARSSLLVFRTPSLFLTLAILSVFPSYLFLAGLLRVGCHLASPGNFMHAPGVGCHLHADDSKSLSWAQAFLASC